MARLLANVTNWNQFPTWKKQLVPLFLWHCYPRGAKEIFFGIPYPDNVVFILVSVDETGHDQEDKLDISLR
jgi:hypothetical protein